MSLTRISDLNKCREIALAYLDEERKQLYFYKKLFSGSFYTGEHSTNFFRDWLAGGSTNNFFFGRRPRSDYANFIQFVDAICLEAPENKAIEIITELSTVKDTQRIQEIVHENKEYLSSKCYYDLLMDLGFKGDINQEYNSKKRKAETFSHRWSKIICIFYAIPQGLIEAAAIKSLPFIAALALPGSAVMISIFIIAAFVNYNFARDDTIKLILRGKMGNLFKREISEDKNEISENKKEISEDEKEISEDNKKINTIHLTGTEIFIVGVFYGLSIFAALCVFSLGVISLQTYLPFVPALFVSATLLIPTSLMFANMVYKFIDHNGLDGIKNYFKTKFIEPWSENKLKVVVEVGKLLFSLIVSVLVCGASYFLYHGKIVKLMGETTLKVAAPVVSLIAAGITSVVKSLFSVSKITELLESLSSKITEWLESLCNYMFKSNKNTSAEKSDEPSPLEAKKETTAEIFNTLKNHAGNIDRLIAFRNSIALVGHVGSETALVSGGFNSEHNNLSSGEVSVCIAGKSIYSFGTTATAFVEGKRHKSIEYHVVSPSTLKMI